MGRRFSWDRPSSVRIRAASSALLRCVACCLLALISLTTPASHSRHSAAPIHAERFGFVCCPGQFGVTDCSLCWCWTTGASQRWKRPEETCPCSSRVDRSIHRIRSRSPPTLPPTPARANERARDTTTRAQRWQPKRRRRRLTYVVKYRALPPVRLPPP